MAFTDQIINDVQIRKANGVIIAEARIDNINKFMLNIDPDRGRSFGGEYAYFKCSRGPLYDNGPCSRISFRAAKYIIHTGHFFLKKPEKEMLMTMLTTHIVNDPRGNKVSTWLALIRYFNTFIIDHDYSKQFILPEDLPIPDYTKLNRSTIVKSEHEKS